MNVPDGGAPLEHRRPKDRCEPDAAVALERKEADRGKAQARVADLGLERAVGPTDEAGGQLAEEDVHDEIVEKADRDREQNEVGEQLLGDVGQREAAPA